MYKYLLSLLFTVAVISCRSIPAKEPSFPGKKSNWKGYTRYDFRHDGRKCIVVVPKKSAKHHPWIWRARFFGHEPQVDLALLEKGYYLAYMNVANMFGSPTAVQHWNKFYKLLTETYHFNSRPALEGMSRGGLIIYNWAIANPTKVACIYGDNPVCDFKSWPAGKVKGKYHAPSWKACLKAYNFKNEKEALQYRGNPIDNLTPLAREVVPILHVCGMADTVVPPAENTNIIEKRYKRLAGKIKVIRKPGMNHHPHCLKEPKPIVDFILKNTVADYHKYHFKLRNGLKNSQIVFERKKFARVAFFGGSITYNPGWRPYLCQYLTKRFPNTKFEFIAAGIPSTGSTPGAFRIVHDVFNHGKIDLLFEEAAVNDKCNERKTGELIHGMEGIVRHARLNNPDMDVVLMHFVDPPKMVDYNNHIVPLAIKYHEKVAEHYQTPSLNLALEVTERINAKQFDWKHDFRNLHPSRFGQNVYIRSMKNMLETAWAKPLTEADQIKHTPLPKKPLDKFSYYNGHYLDIHKVKKCQGFKVDPCWIPKDRTATRKYFVRVPILTADKANSQFTIDFTGSAIGVFCVAGPDSGIIEYSVDGGKFKEYDLFAKHSYHLHIPITYVFENKLSAGKHTLVVRITDKKNPKSKGHACRIAHFLEN